MNTFKMYTVNTASRLTHVCIYVSTYIYIYMHIYRMSCVCARASMYIRMYILICICMYIYICIDIVCRVAAVQARCAWGEKVLTYAHVCSRMFTYADVSRLCKHAAPGEIECSESFVRCLETERELRGSKVSTYLSMYPSMYVCVCVYVCMLTMLTMLTYADATAR
jgi:hypothetical protein